MKWAQVLDYTCSHVFNKHTFLPVYICFASLNRAQKIVEGFLKYFTFKAPTKRFNLRTGLNGSKTSYVASLLVRD